MSWHVIGFSISPQLPRTKSLTDEKAAASGALNASGAQKLKVSHGMKICSRTWMESSSQYFPAERQDAGQIEVSMHR